MLGREHDKLYHVLLTPLEAEHHAEFYYPASVSQSLQLADGRDFDSAQVKVVKKKSLLSDLFFHIIDTFISRIVFSRGPTFGKLTR